MASATDMTGVMIPACIIPEHLEAYFSQLVSETLVSKMKIQGILQDGISW